MAQQPPIG